MASNNISKAEFSRILLIKPSAVGDVVHALPVMEKLRRRYPAAQIDWLLPPENAELVRGHPALSNIVLFARKDFSRDGKRLGAVAGFLRLLGQLRGAKYDLVIDLHGQLRSAIFALATGAPVRIGFDRPVRRRGESTFQGRTMKNVPQRGWAGAREGSWLAYTHRIAIPTLEVHAVDRYLWVGKMLGFEPGPARFDLPIAPEADAMISQELEAVGAGDRPLAVLVPGTMWETKHWTSEGFGAAARELARTGALPVLIGTKAEVERNRRIAGIASGTLDLTGKTTLAGVVALIRRAAIVITNDSGAMHIAAALGRPAISIFGPTNPVQVGPYGQPENVVRLDLACSPCNFRRLSQCPNGHACMRDLKAEMVMERVRAALGGELLPDKAGIRTNAGGI